jgi:hypothetical protein
MGEDDSCMLWLPDLVLVRLIDYLLPSSDAHGTQAPQSVTVGHGMGEEKNAQTQHMCAAYEPGRIPQADVPSHKRSLNSALGGLGGWHATAASTLYHTPPLSQSSFCPLHTHTDTMTWTSTGSARSDRA